MLDKNFIVRKIKLIQEEIAKLEELSNCTFEEIKNDFIKRYSVERALEKIIMRAIDINQHIIAENAIGYETLRGYEDTFHILAKLNVYPEKFSKKIAPSAGLRNRLVHEYNDTQDEIIYSSVAEAIAQYTEYCNYILKYIHT
ncbi:MAG: type VII toxin-antitoxin system HepT family RNase toxin [Candidatus Humimicrobiaceae bacterium]